MDAEADARAEMDVGELAYCPPFGEQAGGAWRLLEVIASGEFVGSAMTESPVALTKARFTYLLPSIVPLSRWPTAL